VRWDFDILVISLIQGLKGKSKEEKAAFIRKASSDVERAKGTQGM
jgi:hypothetical protein